MASGANFVLSGNSRTMSLLRLRGTPDFDRYVQAVRDMAPALGIKPEDVDHIFEPFFTLVSRKKEADLK